MKTQVLFQALLSVCLLIVTTCYGQTGYKLRDLDVKKTGYDLQGTLRVSQSYDKQTKMLTLKMKNEYKHDIFLFQSSTSPHLFVSEYADQRKFPTNSTPISIIGVDITVSKKKIIKPDSTHVIPYNCEGIIAEGFDQVSFEGIVPYFLVNEKEEVIAVGDVWLEEQRFDL
ncbi:hypothetical protein [uncultured Parabacteroides sp.]|uniref:hypothetical protein n=2 Tax=uncultured Parabacteroides sp. TaxID=512312 RepID=UPI00266BEEAF|nr:hypothetical protein [uncultured Parabacteroides sp.]